MKFLLPILFFLFSNNPVMSLAIDIVFLIVIVSDIFKLMKNGYLPLFNILFMKFFLFNQLALTILEVIKLGGYDVDFFYLRNVDYEKINLFTGVGLMLIYLGFNSINSIKKSINLNFLIAKINLKPIYYIIAIKVILQYFDIPALRLPLYIFDFLLNIYLILYIVNDFRLNNPALYLFIFNVVSNLKTGMIGGGFVFILLLGIMYFTLNYNKIRIRLRRNLLFSFSLIFVVAFFLYTLAILQNVKHTVRLSWGGETTEQTADMLTLTYNEMVNPSMDKSEYFIRLLYRLNQAALVSQTMAWVPNEVPFENGATIFRSLRESLTFRLFNASKEKSGGVEKYEKYTGNPLIGGTSMNLEIIGEAYVNFGIYVSFIFFFCLGIFWAYLIILSDNLIFRLNNAFKIPFKLTFITLLFESVSDFQMFFNMAAKYLFILVVLSIILKTKTIKSLSVSKVE